MQACRTDNGRHIIALCQLIKIIPLKFVKKNQKLTGKKIFRYLTKKVLHYYYSGISWYQSQTLRYFIK